MDANAMTPEQLRAAADEIDGGMNRFVKEVEAGGRSYRVDMRRFKSREFVRRLAALQDKGDAASVAEQLELYDYVLAPCAADITKAVTDELGYEDFERWYEIAAEIFEAVNAKNQ